MRPFAWSSTAFASARLWSSFSESTNIFASLTVCMSPLVLLMRRIDAGTALARALGMFATATLWVAATALALPPDLEQAFLQVDANDDGRIAWHEAWANPTVERRFILSDRDHNGTLDRAEFLELITSASHSRT